MEPAIDVERQSARAFRGRRFAVRVAPGLIDSALDETLADALARADSHTWRDVRTTLLDLHLPQEIREDLDALLEANRPASITAYLDLYGTTDDGRPRGVVFVAPFGIRGQPQMKKARRTRPKTTPAALCSDVR
jgi:CRISPR-associated endonuclease/helicase Cas3